MNHIYEPCFEPPEAIPDAICGICESEIYGDVELVEWAHTLYCEDCFRELVADWGLRELCDHLGVYLTTAESVRQSGEDDYADQVCNYRREMA